MQKSSANFLRRFFRRAAARLVVRVLPALAVVAAGIACIWPAPVFAQGVCNRTQQVHEAISAAIGGSINCAFVTPGVMDDITELTVTGMPTSLKAGDFAGLPELKRLILRGHRLAAVPANVFAGLTKLENLDLGGPGFGFATFQTLPANAFAGLGNLKELSLDNNNLRNLPVNVFASLANLETLNLGINFSLTLQANVFARQSKLKMLNLDHVYWSGKHPPVGLFTGLESLTQLQFETRSGPITGLDPGVFNGLPLEKMQRANFKPPAPPASRPLLISRNGALMANWSSSGDANYQVQWKKASATSFAPGDIAAVRTTRYEIRGLEDGADYDVRVFSLPAKTASNSMFGAGWTPSQAARLTYTTPPGKPKNLTVEARESQKLHVSWDKPDGVLTPSGYTLRWKPLAATSFAPADMTSIPKSGPVSHKHTLGGDDGAELVNGTTYEIQVSAGNASGRGEYSDSARGVPLLGICDRTVYVKALILRALGRNISTAPCSQVTDADLAGITSVRVFSDAFVPGTLTNKAFAGMTGLERLEISNTNLGALPENLFAGLVNLKVLHVRDNDFFGLRHPLETLPENLFSGLANLEELDLSGNKFSNLPEGVFAGLANLKKLDLRVSPGSRLRNHAGLTAPPAGLFAGLSKLEELDLRSNQIAALPANIFAGLGGLKVLRLADTSLATLPANQFAGLAKLEHLDLSANILSDLPADVFAGQGKLAWLDLSENNGLGAFRAGAFNGLSLENLTLKGIQVPDKPGEFNLFSGGGMLRAVWGTVAGANYQLHWKREDASAYAPADRATVAAPALTYDITGLDKTAKYDVRITSLPRRGAAASTTYRWSFTESAEPQLADARLPNAPTEPELQARESEKLRVSWTAPDNDGGSPIDAYRVRWKPLAAADFADADTADVAASGFRYDISGLANGTTYEVQIAARNLVGQGGYTSVRGAPRLGICDRTKRVRDAILTRLSRGLGLCGTVTDADLATVKALGFLGRNRVDTLQANDFAGLTGLQTLLISGAGGGTLSYLPEGVFSDLTNLRYLSVRDNHNLQTLPANLFAGMTQLEELQLWGNTLQRLPQNVFAGLARLKKLDIRVDEAPKPGHTGLLSLPANAFADLAALEELDLSGNKFASTLPANVFARLEALKVLRLGDANITALPANLFAGMANLEHLDLSGNKISDLPANVFASQGSLNWLDLSGNNNLGAFRAASFNGLSLEKLALKGINNPPGKPGALRLTPGKTLVRAVWEAVPNANYQLHWKPAAAATFAPVDRATVVGPALTYDITGLAHTAEYDVRITSLPKRALGSGSATFRWSFSEASATTAREPSAPLNLTVRALRSGELAVAWETPRADGGSPLSGYRLRWKPLAATSFAPSNIVDLPVQLSHDIAGLTNDMNYEVQVAAVNLAGVGRYTDAEQGIPLTGICDRTEQVYKAVVEQRSHDGCSQVTAADLAAITTLGLFNKSITSLSANAFAGMTNLQNLHLNQNAIASLPAGVFSGLGNLRTLSLNQNQIASLPANVFVGLANLDRLRLGSNRLTALPANRFKDLAKLTSLELENNRIADLQVNAFAGLGKVTVLNLQNNSLANGDVLRPGVFNGLTPLVAPGRPVVRGIAMPAAPPEVRLTSRDRTLQARWSEVPTAHYHVFWKPVTAAAFAPEDQALVTAGPAHDITGLDNNTRYEVRVAAALSFVVRAGESRWGYTAAQAVPHPPPGAPRNLRASPVNSEELVVEWNAPASDGGTPVTSYILRVAVAGSAEPLRTVIVRAPALTHTLTNLTDGAAYELQIAAQTIAGIGAFTGAIRATPLTGVCDRTAAVRDEIVRQSRAAGCAAVTADQLQAIRIVNLPNKTIASLKANDFAGMGGLQTLALERNQIQTLPANLFAETPKLSLLKLHANALTALPANIFAGLGELAAVHLNDNSLATLPVDIFAGNKLGILYLSGNAGMRLPTGAFNGLTPDVTKLDIPLPAPGNVRAASAGVGEVRATWNAVSGTHYQVRWKANNAAAFAREDAAATTGNSYTVTGLTAGAAYQVKVASVPGTLPSSKIALTTWASAGATAGPPVAPGAPQNVRVTPENPHELSIAWAAPASDGGLAVATYHLRWKLAEAASFAPADRATVDAPGVAYTITGLARGMDYEVQIAAENAVSVGEYGAAAAGHVFGLPDAPRNVQIAATVPKQLDVSWRAPAADGGAPVTSYHLRWKPAAAAAHAPQDRATVDKDTLAYAIRDAGLARGIAYEVQIAAENAAGLGEYSEAARGMVFPPPLAPRELRAQSIYAERLDVSWAAPAGNGGPPPMKYLLRWKPLAATSFAPADRAEVALPAELSHSITGLTLGETYEVQIAAENTAGEGLYASTRALARTGVCDRTPLVRDYIVVRARTDLYSSSQRIPLANSPCATVTAEHLRAITEVNVAFGPLGTLTENAFAGMDNLRKLYLSAVTPRITALPANLFAGLSKLQELRLQGNQISSLPAGVFAGLSELRQLTMQNNQLTALPENVFAGLGELRLLALGGNRDLTTLPANVFAETANLRVLDLSGSRFTAFPPGVFNRVIPGEFKVKGLQTPAPPANFRLIARDGTLRAEWDAAAGAHYQLRWKPAAAATFAPEDSFALRDGGHTITGLPNGAEYRVFVATVPETPAAASSSGEVVWPFAELRGAPFPPPGAPQNARADAVVSGELAASWDAPDNDGGTPILTYHLRWKPLVATSYAPADRAAVAAPALTYDITGLTDGAAYEVQIAAETIGGPGAYAAAVRGTPLLGVCDRSEEVHAEITLQTGRAGCAAVSAEDVRALTELDLSGGEIAALTANDFAGMRELQKLRLDGNELVNLPDGVFADLAKLRELRLNGNLLAALPGEIFDDLVKLRELRLDENALTALPDGIFTNSAELRMLNLRGNAFTALPQNALAGAPNLTGLDAAENEIAALPANAFSALPDLRTLSIGGNAFATLPADVFAGLSHLTQLDLRGHSLTQIPSGVFNGLSPGVLSVRGMDLPPPPDEIRLVSRESVLKVAWDAAAGAQYQLRWKLESAATFAPEDAAATTAARYDITPLKNGATYEVRVAAAPKTPASTAPADEFRAWNFAASRAAPFPPPSVPREVNAGASNPAELAITWIPPEDTGGALVVAYHLRWKKVTASDFAADDSATVDGTAQKYIITGLDNDTVYEAKVAAESLGGMGAYSATVQGTPRTGICGRTVQVHREVVRQLDLAGVALSGCAGVNAGHLLQLTGLDLNNKSIAALQADDFSGMENLRFLHLQDNQLIDLPANVFAGLAKLQTLRLANNAIGAYPANIFAGLSGLRELDLGNNSIPAVSAGLFSGLAELRKLSLHTNGFTALPKNVFADLAKLRELELHQTPLASLPLGAFNGLAPDSLQITGFYLPAPPQGLQVDAGHGEIEVRWNAVVGAQYQVRWKAADAAAFAPADAAATRDTHYTVAGVQNGATYEFRVATVPAAPQAATVGSTGVPDITPKTWRSAVMRGTSFGLPGAPQNPRVVSADEGVVEIAWDAPLDDGGAAVSAYLLRWKPVSAANFADEDAAELAAPAAELKYEITGLTNGTTYQAQIAAKNVVGDGEYADAPPAAPFGKPGKPQNVRAATKQSQELAVSWEAPLDDGGAAVSAYLLRWKPVSAAIFAAGDDAEVEAPKLSYDITGLTNGTTYQVQIAAKTAERTGEYSDPALGAAHRGVCGRIPPVRDAIEAALGGLGCAEVSEEKLREVEELNLRNKGISELPENSFAGMRGLVTLDLTENLLAELPLNVFAGLASLRDLILNQTFLTELPAGVFADLGALRRLELKEVPLEGMPLGAFNGLLPGELRIVGMTMPAAPRDLQLTVRNGELRAQWNEVPGAQYQLRWREAGAAEWAREDAAATAATAHTIAGLTNGTRYEVRVAAVPTAPVTINVFRKIWEAAEAQAAPALVAPDAPRAAQTEAGDKRIEVRWQAPLANGGADITGYHVHYKALAGGGMTYMKTAAGSDLVYTITENLENGATYAVKIAAQNRIGIGEFTAAPQATPFTTPDAPAAVALAPDNEELRVTWEAPDDKGRAVSAYHVRWKLAGAADFAAENAAELSAEIFAHAISGLQNGATYEVQVAAENLAGIGDYAAAARGVPRTVPGAPQSVAASPENSQLQISWAAPNEDGGGQVSGYKLRWKLAAATTFAAEDAAEVSADIFAHTISGLQNGELYRVEIAAKNAAGFGATAAAAGVPRTVPDAPQNLAVNPDNEQLKVSWDAPANDGGDEVSIYLLRWKPVSESEFANAPKIAATTYDITGLENGTTYEVQVSARNAAGDGAYSESARAVPRTVPDAPQNLAVTPGDKQLRVSWAAPAADGGAPVLRYRVRWKLPGDSIDFTDANSRVVDAGVLSHTVAIGRNGTTYEVEVAAQNAAGFGAAVSAESAPRTVPLAPQMIAAAPGNAEITVTWKMPNLDGGAPLLSYRLRWKLAGDSDFAAENAVELPADVLERAITGLNNGATYDVQVAAKNIAGFGEYGESAQATPRDAPGAPKDLAVMPDMGELHITWEAPDSDNGAPVLSYRLRWNLADASDFAAEDMHVVSGDARAHTVTALENGQEYQIEITAGNAAGLGKPAVTQGTPRTVPGLPRDVAVAPYNQELHVTWQAPVENGGAEVRGYSVRWKIAGSAESAHTEAEVTSPTMYTIPGLVNGMTYEVQVAAKNEAGAGEYSAAARAIPRTVPGAPQNLALTPDNAELRVSWDAPDADGGAPVTTYHVRWKTAEGDFAPENAAAFSADVFAGAITGLTNGENYEVKITAENEAGEGEAGIAKAAPRTVPGKPRKVRATASNTDLSITVDWTPPQNNGGAPVTTYLYRWAEKDGSWRPEKIAGGGKARAYTIESGDGLESGGKYQVQIAAVNAAGAGKWADGMFGAGEDKKTFGTPWQFDLDVDGSGAADGRDGTLISRSLNGRALFDSNDEVFAKDAVALAEAAKSKLDSLKIKVVRYEDGGTRLALNVNDVNKTGGEPDHNDGVLIARYLLGLRLDALVAKIDATVNADTIAQNIKPMVESKDLDVNEDGRVTASDGIIVARYLFNVKTEGGLLVSGQAPKAGPNAEEIRAKIRRGRDGLALDIDGNGEVKPDDGTMVFRFLNGQNAEQVFRDADVVNMDELFQKLQSLKPQANSARRE
ncbi:MAG: hypothetical protein IBGAMO2_50011 [Arenicellales bacterium IbO2]|nr:MAG: hypothetical protein IBGAMO2_50011 [Arenicellales bacterium IbO2]